jgi:23S rRNA (cytosine1962-C5)-methyltransferase
MSYTLLDSGEGEKLERFGDYVLRRPCGTAIWRHLESDDVWNGADARFTRDDTWVGTLPDRWEVEHGGLQFRISPTQFGHLGLFPEHALIWEQLQCKKLLNLFAYSGGATLAAARLGAEVVHVDASKGMVAWAQENAALNDLKEVPIRWIIDDALKFMQREVRRGNRYDLILLDPPSFGRGPKGEVFKIEEQLPKMLDAACQLLLPGGRVILSCHTPGYSPQLLCNLLEDRLGTGAMEGGELLLPGKRPLPSGTWARWGGG